MPEWFIEISNSRNPGRQELLEFVDEVERLLDYILFAEEAYPLWQVDPELREMAQEAFADVRQSASELRQAIPEINELVLVQHGLIGAPARFKYNVMNRLARRWARIRPWFTVRSSFRRVFEAVDAHLDSLVDAAGVGGLVKEFKDAILALAPER
jgi:hypothetical protein